MGKPMDAMGAQICTSIQFPNGIFDLKTLCVLYRYLDRSKLTRTHLLAVGFPGDFIIGNVV